MPKKTPLIKVPIREKTISRIIDHLERHGPSTFVTIAGKLKLHAGRTLAMLEDLEKQGKLSVDTKPNIHVYSIKK